MWCLGMGDVIWDVGGPVKGKVEVCGSKVCEVESIIEGWGEVK